jgi:hypothetical protein
MDVRATSVYNFKVRHPPVLVEYVMQEIRTLSAQLLLPPFCDTCHHNRYNQAVH